jgi:hypothetical protein
MTRTSQAAQDDMSATAPASTNLETMIGFVVEFNENVQIFEQMFVLFILGVGALGNVQERFRQLDTLNQQMGRMQGTISALETRIGNLETNSNGSTPATADSPTIIRRPVRPASVIAE